MDELGDELRRIRDELDRELSELERERGEGTDGAIYRLGHSLRVELNALWDSVDAIARCVAPPGS